MSGHYDVIVVGGGFAGLAIAYELALRHAKVLLLEARTIGSGTSGASAGRAQVSESHRGLHMDFVQAGLTRLETLEEELESDFEWRRLGNLMLIEHDHHWHFWQEQVTYLQQRGFTASMLKADELAGIEPALCARRFRGAAWCLEGHLNPLKFVMAYRNAVQRLGVELRHHNPVRELRYSHNRLTGVVVDSELLVADRFVITTGAWTGELLRKIGINLPVQFAHAEALISEPLPPVLHNHIGLADFYETIHNARRAVSIGIAQQRSGGLLITEAVEQTPEIHQRNSAWGIAAMAAELNALFPTFADVRLLRAWAAPSPFLPDEQPAIGWLPTLNNCFVATCFHLTITTMPVLAALMADIISGADPAINLDEFSPDRFNTVGS